MMKWIRRLGLGLLVVLVAGAAVLGYVWRIYLDSGLPTEEVRIPANGETLAGTLWLPEGDGPFPALVILHGSAPAVRSQPAMQMHANAFAKRGIAALVYDKHGFGESSGTYVHEDYRTFIADAHAALDYLKARPDVIPDALGLVGNSESGWFLPEISLARNDIRFAYSRVGPAVPYYQVAEYQQRNRLRRTTGLTSDQIDEIIELMDDRYRFYIEADGDAAFYHAERGALQERVDRAYDEYDSTILPFGPTLSRDWHEQRAARIAHCLSYDPKPFLMQNPGVPFLYVFGEHDVNVPTKASVRVLEEVRAATGQEISIHVYPGDDHTLNRMTRILTATYPAGYFDRMVDFALEALAATD
jgi:dienelactone hydrolase